MGQNVEVAWDKIQRQHGTYCNIEVTWNMENIRGNMGQNTKIQQHTEYGGKTVPIEVAWEKIQGYHGTKYVHRWQGLT